ncbi:MAG: hypothetical protein ATN35_09250 [Epulopiscium sp. Nele67-Bin004]|nr:MAG: hypothetical protein ATN35_09250 [Epulopiscium sp. Nele67-Bin004]
MGQGVESQVGLSVSTEKTDAGLMLVSSCVCITPASVGLLKNSLNLKTQKNFFMSIYIVNSLHCVVGTKDNPFERADIHESDRDLLNKLTTFTSGSSP